jgi:hypothetical protein
MLRVANVTQHEDNRLIMSATIPSTATRAWSAPCRNILCLLVAAFLIPACASIPMGSQQEDLVAKAFVARPGKAAIYVYRSETLGFAAPIMVAVDGRPVGKTLGQTYLVLELEPGEHEIASIAEDMATVRVMAQAGKSYYIWQEVKVGMWKVRSRLQEVGESQGQSGVAECAIAKAGA